MSLHPKTLLLNAANEAGWDQDSQIHVLCEFINQKDQGESDFETYLNKWVDEELLCVDLDDEDEPEDDEYAEQFKDEQPDGLLYIKREENREWSVYDGSYRVAGPFPTKTEAEQTRDWKVVQQGRQAYVPLAHMDEQVRLNPYMLGTNEYNLWQQGWQLQQLERFPDLSAIMEEMGPPGE